MREARCPRDANDGRRSSGPRSVGEHGRERRDGFLRRWGEWGGKRRLLGKKEAEAATLPQSGRTRYAPLWVLWDQRMEVWLRPQASISRKGALLGNGYRTDSLRSQTREARDRRKQARRKTLVSFRSEDAFLKGSSQSGTKRGHARPPERHFSVCLY